MNASHQQCYACGTQNPEMMRCSDCKVAHYCSAKCQQDDWMSGQHALECIGMKTKREEIESRAAGRLRQAATARLLQPGGSAKNEDLENEEGHQRRLRRFMEESRVVVEPGVIVTLPDRRKYGVTMGRSHHDGSEYPITLAGYLTMTGKFSFIQDAEGNAFRRRYLVSEGEGPRFIPAVNWEKYDERLKAWRTLPARTDPETSSKWEIYIP